MFLTFQLLLYIVDEIFRLSEGNVMQGMTDHQFDVVLSLIVEQLKDCKTVEEYQKVTARIEKMKKNK